MDKENTQARGNIQKYYKDEEMKNSPRVASHPAMWKDVASQHRPCQGDITKANTVPASKLSPSLASVLGMLTLPSPQPTMWCRSGQTQ
jgi:hypothetical protein